MMRVQLLSSLMFSTVMTALMLSGCGEKPSDESPQKVETPSDVAGRTVTDGRIVVSSLPKVREPNACILPITITNGKTVETRVSMMGFTVTGSGQKDSGNMFEQTVAPGETNTARLLFPSRKCEELSVITAPIITCKNSDGDCVEDVEFEAVDGLIIQRE